MQKAYGVVLLLLTALLSAVNPADRQPTGQWLFEPDSTVIEITPLWDSLGILNAYQVYVFTPICEVEQCYSVELHFYSDPMGNFLSYDTLKGKGLTKLDHVPFSADDYQKLNHILRDHNSVLSGYKKEELVKNTRESEVEGFTGATALEIKENVIEGAVYSCYTLWHIAHGPLVDSLQSYTASLFGDGLIQKLFAENDQQINYFLLDHFSTQQYMRYMDQVLQTVAQGTGYYPKNALEKMPIPVLNSYRAQQFLADHFAKLDYYAQVALLKKLKKELLTDRLKQALKQTLETRNSLKDELIKQLIE